PASMRCTPTSTWSTRATAAPTRSPSGSSTRSSTASHRPTRDYTLVLSRVMFISKHAKHPNAAKLWTDFVLSQRGQKIIGDAIELFAVRDDVDARYSAAALRERIGSAVQTIPLDPFFFQAEDGIRDYKVTGVQTCALPI